MKITVAKDRMVNGLQLVHGVVGTRTTLPILSNVLLKADKGKVWLTTTDLEVGIRCGIEADVEKSGATTLPVRRLLSIVKELPESAIEIEVDEKNVASITCGASFFKILGLSEDEFPPLPDVSGGKSYSIERSVLRDMLQKTVYAASADEMRYMLNGNLLSFKGEKLMVVATDGRRLALAEQEVEFPKDAEVDLIVPTKAVNELLRSLHGEGAMKIYAVKNQVAFEFGDVLLISKLIEGQYPNFRQVIPSQSEQRIAVEREILLTAIRRVALLASDKSNAVKMVFSKNKLNITITSPDVGEARESIPVKYTGKDITIAFNPDFLMDPLRNLASDEVYLEITDELSPGVIKCDTAFLYVIMPMRIN
jgi:DNA polymerase-3 subunit beta